MTSILSKILEDKRLEVNTLKELVTPESFESQIEFVRPRRSLAKVLRTPGIIAEIKKRSPSKGVLRAEINVPQLAAAYERAGAAGISILTDQPYFGGSPLDLAAGRQATMVPILRKDFIIDELQLYQARALGADVILLIAAALEPTVLRSLARKAKALELEVLLEVHSLEELEASLTSDAALIGVNNRDLNTFAVSLERCEELASSIPSEFIKVSESGISSPDDINRLMTFGYTGFLIGETFLKAADPELECKRFVEALSVKG